ncbi:MAG: hypothetical protein OXH85_06475 [Truepera sp.]|nr:hypothetical protein [Truepera sp.]
MLRRFQTFLLSSEPSEAEAVEALRMLYAVAFLAQMGLAGLVGISTSLFGSGASSRGIFGLPLLGVSMSMPVLALVLSLAIARTGGKPAALTATILAAVLLAAPAWLLAFALATGHGDWPVLAMAGVVAFGYALGLLLIGRFAPHAVRTVS